MSGPAMKGVDFYRISKSQRTRHFVTYACSSIVARRRLGRAPQATPSPRDRYHR